MDNKEILKVLADNPALMEATKEAVLAQFAEIPFSEGASDELLGQITRARFIGRQRVEAAFKDIAAFKSTPEPVDKDNPAY